MEHTGRKSNSILDCCFFIQKKLVIDASPNAVWNVVSNVQTYDQWCDFKIAGMIFQDAQVFLQLREAPNNASSTRLRVSKLIEPDIIEFSYGYCSRYITFELRQTDENETEILYKRANVYWIIPILLLSYSYFVTVIMLSEMPGQVIFSFYGFIIMLSLVLLWQSITRVASRMEGALINLKHVVMTSHSSQGQLAVIAQAENVRATTVTPLEVQAPLHNAEKV
jgi:hypothetical protein